MTLYGTKECYNIKHSEDNNNYRLLEISTGEQWGRNSTETMKDKDEKFYQTVKQKHKEN